MKFYLEQTNVWRENKRTMYLLNDDVITKQYDLTTFLFYFILYKYIFKELLISKSSSSKLIVLIIWEYVGDISGDSSSCDSYVDFFSSV